MLTAMTENWEEPENRIEDSGAALVELYRREEVLELRSTDWRTALQIFNEMGWAPKRCLVSYASPLWFVTNDEARAMHDAGQALFAEIDKEPIISTSVPMDLGVFYRISQFVGNGAFVVGNSGAYDKARANGDLQ